MDIIKAIVGDQTLQVITVLALLCALADTAMGVIGAIRTGEFTLSKIANWLMDHVIARVVPIILLAFLSAALGAVVPEGADPALLALMGSATVAAWAAILAYLAETVASLNTHLKETTTGTASP